MKRVLFLVLWLLASYLTYSQNLAINPGFESWSKINKPSGWTHIENCLKDSLTFKSGRYSCQHTGGSAATDIGQTISVSPGKSYALSFYFKTVIASSGNGSRIWCYWKDSGGENISDNITDAILRPSKYIKSELWDHFSVTVTAPPSAASFYLELRTYPNSIAWWDEIIFEETIASGFNETRELVPEIYPNPASDLLTIRNLNNMQHIDIYSFAGILSWSSDHIDTNEVTIPVAELNNGIYLICFKMKNGIITRKFIKR